MAHGRQSSEWFQTFAIIETINNLFRKPSDRFNIRKLIPSHLKGPERNEEEREPTPEENAVGWDMLSLAFGSGGIRQR